MKNKNYYLKKIKDELMNDNVLENLKLKKNNILSEEEKKLLNIHLEES